MNLLSFGIQRPDAVVTLNGKLDQLDVALFAGTCPLVAADGAANSLVEMGIVPDVVIGDMDSVESRLVHKLSKSIEFLHVADQESTDFEKALRYCSGKSWRHVVVLGMHGGDLEHTLNNWSVLMRYGRSISLIQLEGTRTAIPIYDAVTCPLTIGEVISIIPQHAVTLTTSGLQWNLNKEELHFGSREGARNRVTSSNVELLVHEGSMLLFFSRRDNGLPCLI